MRILHVFDHSLPVQSGYAFRSAAILREQCLRGWETAQLTGPKQEIFSAGVDEIDGLRFYRTSESRGMAAGLPVLNQAAVVSALRARLRQVIALERPDIVQAHSPCLNGLAALGCGKPLVYELRSSWEDAAVSSGLTTEGSVRYRMSRWLETFVLRRADAVTVICEGLREEVIRRGVPADRVTVIPNAVDANSFARAEGGPVGVRRRFGLEGKRVLAFIGSFFAWEGLSLLIEALPAILERQPEVRVLLVGAGQDEPTIRRAVERLGVSQQVIFAGQVPHKDVRALYDIVDVLIYPRLPMRLTDMVTPLKPLEAMALGKVFIASDVGGHRELVRDGETGVLFRAGDSRALSRAVLDVIDNRPLQERLIANGHRFVREERTWARAVANYEGLYARLLGRPVPGELIRESSVGV